MQRSEPGGEARSVGGQRVDIENENPPSMSGGKNFKETRAGASIPFCGRALGFPPYERMCGEVKRGEVKRGEVR